MKKSFLLLLSIFLVGIFIINLNVSAVGEVSYCCERTVEGAWCQNVDDISKCQTGGDLNNPVPTSCESTSYCKLGTCINSQEGTCLPNVPERVCQDNNGVWQEGLPDEIPQCQLGCCLLGDQAAFVTNAGCQRLSFLHGIENQFIRNIQDIEQCLTSATPRVKGACVLDSVIERTCRFLARSECTELGTSSSADTTIEFFEDKLCSAVSLNTNCGKSQQTTCIEGKDEVYFLDSCGNLANRYDASKINDQDYWTNIYEKDESCGFDSSNANSRSCGNCDYFLGSTCKAFERGDSNTVKPTYGNNVCADLGCKYQGQEFQHGERWCSGSAGVSDENLPGSESFRLLCYNGEVTSELCGPSRQEICIPDEVNGFKVAGCRLNRWRDCYLNDNQIDCEDTEERDCSWLKDESVFRDDRGDKFVLDTENKEDVLVEQERNNDGELEDKKGEGLSGATCVPKYSPGFDFWEPEGTAETQCRLADDFCLVKYERPLLFGGWSCKENCWCVDDDEGKSDGKIDKDWLNNRNQLCESIGDCGSSKNYIGEKGYNELEDLYSVEIAENEEELEGVLGQ